MKYLFPGNGVQIPLSFDTHGVCCSLNSSQMTGKSLKTNFRVGLLHSLFIYPALFSVLRIFISIWALNFLAARFQKVEILIWDELKNEMLEISGKQQQKKKEDIFFVKWGIWVILNRNILLGHWPFLYCKIKKKELSNQSPFRVFIWKHLKYAFLIFCQILLLKPTTLWNFCKFLYF